MARPKPRGQAQWEQEGYEAVLDLLSDQLVAPWGEIEARIAHQPGWKDFYPVQPLQLSAARQRFRDETPHPVIEETTDHVVSPVTTLRLPFEDGRKREIERARGRKRKLYRKYLSWTNDQALCGKWGERITYASLQALQTDAALWVPPQTIGEISEVGSVEVEPGPLDALAHILELDDEGSPIGLEVPLVVEVKNVRGWIYANNPYLWELLVKASSIAVHRPVVPVLICRRAAWGTWHLGWDLGFWTCQTWDQFFRPTIPDSEFDEVASAFGLQVLRHEASASEAITRWFLKYLRAFPESPPEEEIPWYRRQAERFSTIAPLILEFSDLAESLGPAERRNRFQEFRDRLPDHAPWPLVGGYF